MKVLLIAIALCTTASAQVHKCVTDSGAVRYSDKPCPGGASAAPVKILRDTSSTPYIPDLNRTEPDDIQAQQAPPQQPQVAPRRASYECSAANGDVWYQHTPCPREANLATGRIARFNHGGTAMQTGDYEITQRIVKRREACKAIEAVDAHNRSGSYRDQKDTTEDKAKGRDKC